MQSSQHHAAANGSNLIPPRVVRNRELRRHLRVPVLLLPRRVLGRLDRPAPRNGRRHPERRPLCRRPRHRRTSRRRQNLHGCPMPVPFCRVRFLLFSPHIGSDVRSVVLDVGGKSKSSPITSLFCVLPVAGPNTLGPCASFSPRKADSGISRNSIPYEVRRLCRSRGILFATTISSTNSSGWRCLYSSTAARGPTPSSPPAASCATGCPCPPDAARRRTLANPCKPKSKPPSGGRTLTPQPRAAAARGSATCRWRTSEDDCKTPTAKHGGQHPGAVRVHAGNSYAAEVMRMMRDLGSVSGEVCPFSRTGFRRSRRTFLTRPVSSTTNQFRGRAP